MAEFEVTFIGSKILYSFCDQIPSFSELLKERKVRVSFDPLPNNFTPRCLVSRRNKLVHPAWDAKLILRLIRSVSSFRRELIAEKIEELMKPFEVEERLDELLRPYQDQDEKLILSSPNLRYVSDHVDHKQLQKKKKIIHRCAEIAAIMHHKITKKDSNVKISQKFKLPLHRVRKIVKLIEESEGGVLEVEMNRLQREVENYETIREALFAHRNDTKFLELTVTQARARIAQELPEGVKLSRRKYFEVLKTEGFRFRALRYQPRLARPLTPDQKINFLILLRQIVLEENRFHVLFLDESSVVPENFRKKRWFAHGVPNRIESRMKYEKLMFIAAMSTSEVSAVQLLGSGFNGCVFVSFVHGLLKSLKARLQNSRQIVLFLDNSTCHHSRLLSPVLTHFGAIALFNAPHHSHLNPIEFLWEHAKRPLRRMSDYPS